MTVVHPDGEPHGPLVINASDFDPAVHTAWTDAPDAVPDASAAAKPSKRGSKS